MYGDHVDYYNAMAELNLPFVLLRRHSDKRNDNDNDDDKYMISKQASSSTLKFVFSYKDHNLQDPSFFNSNLRSNMNLSLRLHTSFQSKHFSPQNLCLHSFYSLF